MTDVLSRQHSSASRYSCIRTVLSRVTPSDSAPRPQPRLIPTRASARSSRCGPSSRSTTRSRATYSTSSTGAAPSRGVSVAPACGSHLPTLPDRLQTAPTNQTLLSGSCNYLATTCLCAVVAMCWVYPVSRGEPVGVVTGRCETCTRWLTTSYPSSGRVVQLRAA